MLILHSPSAAQGLRISLDTSFIGSLIFSLQAPASSDWANDSTALTQVCLLWSSGHSFLIDTSLTRPAFSRHSICAVIGVCVPPSKTAARGDVHPHLDVTLMSVGQCPTSIFLIRDQP